MTYIISLILLLASAQVCAQQHLFRMYRYHSQEVYNFTIEKPKGFKVIENRPFQVAGIVHWSYSASLESDDKACRLLYPHLLPLPTDISRQMFGEIKAAQGKNPLDNSIALDTIRCVRCIAQPDRTDYLQADTVFIYPMQLAALYEGIYSECIGICARKQGHPDLIAKILLTAEGAKRKEEYIELFFKHLHYGEEPPAYDAEKLQTVRRNIKRRSRFHNPRKMDEMLRWWCPEVNAIKNHTL